MLILADWANGFNALAVLLSVTAITAGAGILLVRNFRLFWWIIPVWLIYVALVMADVPSALRALVGREPTPLIPAVRSLAAAIILASLVTYSYLAPWWRGRR